MTNHPDYGPVVCTRGPHKGRIGYFDDETSVECDICEQACCQRMCKLDIDCDDCNDAEHGNCEQYGIVYWGEPLLCNGYQLIPIAYLSSDIPMSSIVARIDHLRNKVARMKESKAKSKVLQELDFVTSIMYERHIESMVSTKTGLQLFISHSSKDKGFANCLYNDLVKAGHTPWLDEWDIRAGQVIPEAIQKALDKSDYILLLLSPQSVVSEWVKTEWQAMYWKEIQTASVRVIPILIDDCEIPTFLKIKKYVDMREDYSAGLQLLFRSF